ncbi:MAG: DUF3015 domain-containing protein [Gammaproteobacteria bacterium]
MKLVQKGSIVLALTLATPLAMAAQNVGSCGWGSKLFDGQSGMGPQVLAVTTNGTSGNQTFGITSGTSGCTQDGTVSSNWQTAMFIDGNKNKLARDMARGQGETLDSLAALLGIPTQQKNDFYRLTKANYGRIFPDTNVTAEEVRVSLRAVMTDNKQLSRYTTNI